VLTDKLVGISTRRRRAERAIRVARRLRDAGIAQAEASDRYGWNTRLIDQAINAFARTGDRFSANDLRELLPDDLPGPLYGARFMAACTEKRIERVGRTTSTKANTHSKDIGVWVGIKAPVVAT
jgi:hypothetical protein